MMTTIAVTNRKGGVGKTSHALHIAAGLATVGYRVGLIDTDSQGHIAVSLGIEPTDALFEALVNKAPLDDTLFPVIDPDKYSTPDNLARGELRVLSSADYTYRITHELANRADTFVFLRFIDDMKKAFNLHYVIIDTSPTLKDLDGYIYLATDAFVFVTEVEPLSVQGLSKVIENMLVVARDRQEQMKRPTTVLGIIPNKKRNTVAHDLTLQELEALYPGFVWKPVRLDTVWTEASMKRQVIFRYAPSSKAARESWAVVAKIVEAEKAWRANVTR